MIKSKADLHARIEDVFNTSVSVCAFIKPFALRVEFEDQTNIGDILLKTRIPFSVKNPYYKNRPLYDLSQDVPLVVFSNAVIEEPEPSNNPLVRAVKSLFNHGLDKSIGSIKLTGGRTERSWLKQDPFHRDDIGHTNNSTLLYKPLDSSRSAPTYYATQDSVQQAIKKLSETDIPKNIREALLAMAEDGYSFSSRNKEIAETRAMLGTGYEDFSQHVFSIVPDEEKYEQNWKAGEADVVMSSNQKGILLHGRPASQTDLGNCLTGISLYPS